MSTWDDDEDDWDDGVAEGSDDLDDEPTVPCPYCRRPIHEDAQRCPYCEQYISEEDRPTEPKPWWLVAGVVVCLLLVVWWILA
ncbi:MAG: hypothetical protein WD845_11455 [Pirellulales bacterium]